VREINIAGTARWSGGVVATDRAFLTSGSYASTSENNPAQHSSGRQKTSDDSSHDVPPVQM
jgi:hypothetical protein